MISLKQWAALLMFYLFYLLGGALVFLYLESDSEVKNLEETHNLQKKLSINLYFIENEPIKEELQLTLKQLELSMGRNLLLPPAFQEELLLRIVPLDEIPSEHPIDITNSSELLDEVVPQFNNDSSSLSDRREELLSPHPLDGAIINGNVKWTIWNAFFFSFTVITTIGFGHMSPSTEAGQGFCIAYSLLGVPLNGIVFAGLADLFATKIIERIEGGHYKKKGSMCFDSLLYLVPGLFLLVLLPAMVFMFIENWSFLVSFYFAFITLTTIGFGDFVAGQSSNASIVWMWPYRIFIMVWIIFGLGYLLMVIAFIQRALRSKEVRRIDRKMRQTFKDKIGIIQNNVSRDIIRMRSVLEGIAKLETSEQLSIAGSHSNEAYEDDTVVNAGDSSADPEKKGGKRKFDMDLFLQLAESILKQSENDLENRVNEYNRTLTSLNELSIDENDNAFRNSLFPARDSIRVKRTTVRRPSIWTSSAPPSMLLENESNIDEAEKGQNDLKHLIEKFHEMVETAGSNSTVNRLSVPDVNYQRRHSTAVPSIKVTTDDNAMAPNESKIDALKRRQTVAELHVDNQSEHL